MIFEDAKTNGAIGIHVAMVNLHCSVGPVIVETVVYVYVVRARQRGRPRTSRQHIILRRNQKSEFAKVVIF